MLLLRSWYSGTMSRYRNGYSHNNRPASTGVYFSMWENKMQELVVRNFFFLYIYLCDYHVHCLPGYAVIIVYDCIYSNCTRVGCVRISHIPGGWSENTVQHEVTACDSQLTDGIRFGGPKLTKLTVVCLSRGAP